MARGKLAFRERDVTRAVKAAKKAGVEVARVRIAPDGTIVIDVGKPIPLAPDDQPNEWDGVFGGKKA